MFIAMCLQMVILSWWCLRIARVAFPDWCCTPPPRSMPDPRWLLQIKFAFMALCITVSLCYIVVHSVPRFSHCIGSFARELFCVIQGTAAIAVNICLGSFYVSQLSQITLDDAALARVANNQYHMATTILWLTGTHLMVPVRWHVLIPLELVSVLWFPFWVVFTSSWTDGSFDIVLRLGEAPHRVHGALPLQEVPPGEMSPRVNGIRAVLSVSQGEGSSVRNLEPSRFRKPRPAGGAQGASRRHCSPGPERALDPRRRRHD